MGSAEPLWVASAWTKVTGGRPGAAFDAKVLRSFLVDDPDVASLRRYLVEYGLVTREAGVYRRAAAAARE
jgi:hypothetical protein